MSSKVSKLISTYRQHLTVHGKAGWPPFNVSFLRSMTRQMNSACVQMSRSSAWLFGGERINDHHLKRAVKDSARERKT